MSRVQRKIAPRWRQAGHAIHNEIADRTEKAAEDLRDYIAAALDAGSAGLHSDTHALAQSLYVKATGRDDYAEARGAARAAFAGHPSRFRGQAVSAKSLANFEAVIAPNTPLVSASPHVSVAIVATMLSYGWWWEFGHDNGFTRNSDDKRPWMLPPALEWAHTRLAGFYRDLQISL